jgi:hypothetical protein
VLGDDGGGEQAGKKLGIVTGRIAPGMRPGDGGRARHDMPLT